MENTMTMESKNERMLKRAFFPVKKVRVGKNRHYIMNMENTEYPISEVTDRYTVVENEKIVRPFIEKFGIDNLKSYVGYGRGKYYHFEFFTGREFNLGTDNEPDIIKEKIIIKNSYDKSKSFEFIMGAYRMVCSNGLYAIAETLVSYKKKHVGKIPIKSIIGKVFKSCENNSFETWMKLSKIGLTLDEQIALIDKFNAKELKESEKAEYWNPKHRFNRKVQNWTKHFVKKSVTIDNRRDVWGLYNQFNRAIEKSLTGKSQIDQRIKLNQKVEKFLIAEFNLN